MSMFNRLPVIASICALLLLFAGCSSSGDGTATNSSTIQLSYPTPRANLGDMADDTVVTGKILDTVTGIEAADINFIDVNGQFATMDPSDASRWSVRVPLNTPTTTLNVSVGLADSFSTLSSNFVINNNAPISNPSSMAIDPANNRALMTDSDLNILETVDLVTGTRRVLSGAGRGSGPNLFIPVAVVLDADRNRALVLINPDPSPSILAVDLATGDRSVLSGPGVGGPLPFSVSDNSLALDDDAVNKRNRVVVVDRGQQRLLAVDLTDGKRTVFSDTGDGAPLSFYSNAIATDPAGDRVFLASDNKILEVDLDSGLRTVFSVLGTGIDTTFWSPGTFATAIAVAPPDRLLVLNGPDRQIIAVDRSTGDRALLAGIGPDLQRPLSLAVDAANSRALVGDDTLDAVLAVDLASGDRTVFSESGTGDGLRLSALYVELDPTNNRALMSDEAIEVLLSVDLASGDRTVISGDTVGTGPVLKTNRAFALDLGNNRALVLNGERAQVGTPANVALLAIDLATGNRSVISDNSTGSGPQLKSGESVALDAVNQRALVADPGLRALLVIELGSGERAIVSR